MSYYHLTLAIRKFFSNPKNIEEFEKWKQEKMKNERKV